MINPQFRKFIIDWGVYKTIGNIPNNQITIQLYNLCDETVQNSIINTNSNFTSLTEKEMLDTIEAIATKKSNPTVHRLSFANIHQSEGETIQNFLIRLKSTAQDCENSCPNCDHDLQELHIKDQFIRGLQSETLQADLLAKAGYLKTLNDIIKHAEAFETALRDQLQLQQPNEYVAKISQYRKSKQGPPNKSKKACPGCGSTTHGPSQRSSVCPAWGKQCLNCNKYNHFAKVCRQPLTESANALIAHINSSNHHVAATSDNITEISAEISLCNSTSSSAVTLPIFPDSGASICLAGPSLLSSLDISNDNLISCHKNITAVGGTKLHCKGWVPLKFTIGQHNTIQPVFICDKVNRIYFSRKGCQETNILPPSFPYPMPNNTATSATVEANHLDKQTTLPISHKTCENTTMSPTTTTLPTRPTQLPYPPKPENIEKLKELIVQKFSSSAFDTKIFYLSWIPNQPTCI